MVIRAFVKIGFLMLSEDVSAGVICPAVSDFVTVSGTSRVVQ